MSRVGQRVSSIYETYQETQEILVWVWFEIVSEKGRRYTARALITMLVTMLLTMALTFVMKEIVNALAVDQRALAFWLLLLGVGGLYLVSVLLEAYHDFMRELAWNDNYRNVVTGLSNLFFKRTVGEMIAEDHEVGPEQVESAKDRIQNILYLVLFEGSVVVTTVIAATALMFTVDLVAASIMVVMTLANIGWFLYFNAELDGKIKDIDEAMRRVSRRTVEKWNFNLSTKTNGVEDKVCHQIQTELAEPMDADMRVWAYWFIPIDLIRMSANSAVVVAVLAYGIVWGNWPPGNFAAIFAWMSLVMEKYGFLGHLMRHMTSQVARIKAIHQLLTTEPPFIHDEGIEYQGGVQ